MTLIVAMIVPTRGFYPTLQEEGTEREEGQHHDLGVSLQTTFSVELYSSLNQIFPSHDWAMHAGMVAIGPIHIQFDDARLVHFDP